MSDWARLNGVHPKTAYKWWRSGTLPVPARQINARVILVDVPDPVEAGAVAVYARVSSQDQRGDLDRQVARVTVWATGQGLSVGRVVAEVGSGMNGDRAKLKKLLADRSVSTIVVEHRDRLGRMNTELVEAALAASGRRVLVVDPGEVDDDLVRDMVEVLTSFCARLYGKRGARSRANRALRTAAVDPTPGKLS